MNTSTPQPVNSETVYTYLGDRLTCPALRLQQCTAVRNKKGKCMRGKNGAMLVHFGDKGVQVIIGRRLRKTFV